MSEVVVSSAVAYFSGVAEAIFVDGLLRNMGLQIEHDGKKVADDLLNLYSFDEIKKMSDQEFRDTVGWLIEAYDESE